MVRNILNIVQSAVSSKTAEISNPIPQTYEYVNHYAGGQQYQRHYECGHSPEAVGTGTSVLETGLNAPPKSSVKNSGINVNIA